MAQLYLVDICIDVEGKQPPYLSPEFWDYLIIKDGGVIALDRMSLVIIFFFTISPLTNLVFLQIHDFFLVSCIFQVQVKDFFFPFLVIERKKSLLLKWIKKKKKKR